MHEINNRMEKQIQIIIRAIIEYVLFLVSAGFLYLIHEQTYQTSKDYMLFCGLSVFMVLIFIIRKISFKNKINLIWLILCLMGVFLYIRICGINSANYGESYSKVVQLKVLLYGLSVFLLPDIIVNRPQVSTIKYKSPLLWLMIIASIVYFSFNFRYIVIIFPIIVLFLTDIDKEHWTELMDCLCAALYSVFAILFARSLIFKPDFYEIDGRYAGTFLNNSKAGELCGIAAICVLYFFIRWLYSNERRMNKIVLLLVMSAYVVFASHIVAGRAGEAGVLLAIVLSFVFLHNGVDIKVTYKRVAIVLSFLIVGFLSVLILAFVLDNAISRGMLKFENLSYFLQHVAAMANKTQSKGTYAQGTLLNAIDFFSSGRLTLWRECAEDIVLWGRVANARLWTHSTYVYWFVGYGIIGGAIISVWFIAVIVESIRGTIKKNQAVSFTLIWVSFIAGFISASNEYLTSIGMLVLILLLYPLLRNQEIVKEKPLAEK